MATQTKQNPQDNKVYHLLLNAGFCNPTKIANTLQGSVWSVQPPCKSSNSIIVKITNKELHSKSIAIVGETQHVVFENIESEINILKHLTATKCPDSMVKYMNSVKTHEMIFLFLSNGGTSLFDFVLKAHKLISCSYLSINEWMKMCKIIFRQMIDFVEYIHSMNVCHFDLSLENFLINTDVSIQVKQQTSNGAQELYFLTENVQIKGCDFGLAQLFHNTDFMCSKYCGKTKYQSPEITDRQTTFNAKSNDIFCLGVCLFMMCVGCCPWPQASRSCAEFASIVNGDLYQLLAAWNRSEFVNTDLINLLQSIFKYEDERCDITSIKKSKWLNCNN